MPKRLINFVQEVVTSLYKLYQVLHDSNDSDERIGGLISSITKGLLGGSVGQLVTSMVDTSNVKVTYIQAYLALENFYDNASSRTKTDLGKYVKKHISDSEVSIQTQFQHFLSMVHPNRIYSDFPTDPIAINQMLPSFHIATNVAPVRKTYTRKPKVKVAAPLVVQTQEKVVDKKSKTKPSKTPDDKPKKHSEAYTKLRKEFYTPADKTRFRALGPLFEAIEQADPSLTSELDTAFDRYKRLWKKMQDAWEAGDRETSKRRKQKLLKFVESLERKYGSQKEESKQKKPIPTIEKPKRTTKGKPGILSEAEEEEIISLRGKDLGKKVKTLDAAVEAYRQAEDKISAAKRVRGLITRYRKLVPVVLKKSKIPKTKKSKQDVIDTPSDFESLKPQVEMGFVPEEKEWDPLEDMEPMPEVKPGIRADRYEELMRGTETPLSAAELEKVHSLEKMLRDWGLDDYVTKIQRYVNRVVHSKPERRPRNKDKLNALLEKVREELLHGKIAPFKDIHVPFKQVPASIQVQHVKALGPIAEEEKEVEQEDPRVSIELEPIEALNPPPQDALEEIPNLKLPEKIVEQIPNVGVIPDALKDHVGPIDYTQLKIDLEESEDQEKQELETVPAAILQVEDPDLDKVDRWWKFYELNRGKFNDIKEANTELEDLKTAFDTWREYEASHGFQNSDLDILDIWGGFDMVRRMQIYLDQNKRSTEEIVAEIEAYNASYHQKESEDPGFINRQVQAVSDVKIPETPSLAHASYGANDPEINRSILSSLQESAKDRQKEEDEKMVNLAVAPWVTSLPVSEVPLSKQEIREMPSVERTERELQVLQIRETEQKQNEHMTAQTRVHSWIDQHFGISHVDIESPSTLFSIQPTEVQSMNVVTQPPKYVPLEPIPEIMHSLLHEQEIRIQEPMENKYEEEKKAYPQEAEQTLMSEYFREYREWLGTRNPTIRNMRMYLKLKKDLTAAHQNRMIDLIDQQYQEWMPYWVRQYRQWWRNPERNKNKIINAYFKYASKRKLRQAKEALEEFVEDTAVEDIRDLVGYSHGGYYPSVKPWRLGGPNPKAWPVPKGVGLTGYGTRKGVQPVEPAVVPGQPVAETQEYISPTSPRYLDRIQARLEHLNQHPNEGLTLSPTAYEAFAMPTLAPTSPSTQVDSSMYRIPEFQLNVTAPKRKKQIRKNPMVNDEKNGNQLEVFPNEDLDQIHHDEETMQRNEEEGMVMSMLSDRGKYVEEYLKMLSGYYLRQGEEENLSGINKGWIHETITELPIEIKWGNIFHKFSRTNEGVFKVDVSTVYAIPALLGHPIMFTDAQVQMLSQIQDWGIEDDLHARKLNVAYIMYKIKQMYGEEEAWFPIRNNQSTLNRWDKEWKTVCETNGWKYKRSLASTKGLKWSLDDIPKDIREEYEDCRVDPHADCYYHTQTFEIPVTKEHQSYIQQKIKEMQEKVNTYKMLRAYHGSEVGFNATDENKPSKEQIEKWKADTKAELQMVENFKPDITEGEEEILAGREPAVSYRLDYLNTEEQARYLRILDILKQKGRTEEVNKLQYVLKHLNRSEDVGDEAEAIRSYEILLALMEDYETNLDSLEPPFNPYENAAYQPVYRQEIPYKQYVFPPRIGPWEMEKYNPYQ